MSVDKQWFRESELRAFLGMVAEQREADARSSAGVADDYVIVIERDENGNQVSVYRGSTPPDDIVQEMKHVSTGPRYRDAKTGQYVKEEYAEAHPDTTFKDNQ